MIRTHRLTPILTPLSSHRTVTLNPLKHCHNAHDLFSVFILLKKKFPWPIIFQFMWRLYSTGFSCLSYMFLNRLQILMRTAFILKHKLKQHLWATKLCRVRFLFRITLFFTLISYSGTSYSTWPWRLNLWGQHVTSYKLVTSSTTLLFEEPNSA